ncbi:hypothetical protein GCM10027074_47520 [Streptomyces deserti]
MSPLSFRLGSPKSFGAKSYAKGADAMGRGGPDLLSSTPRPVRLDRLRHRDDRALSAYARKELGMPKHRMHALGHWRAS